MASVGAARAGPGPGPGQDRDQGPAAPTEAMGLGRALAWAHLRYMYYVSMHFISDFSLCLTIIGGLGHELPVGS